MSWTTGFFPLGSCHDSTTDGDGKEVNDKINYVTNWIKRTHNGRFVTHL